MLCDFQSQKSSNRSASQKTQLGMECPCCAFVSPRMDNMRLHLITRHDLSVTTRSDLLCEGSSRVRHATEADLQWIKAYRAQQRDGHFLSVTRCLVKCPTCATYSTQHVHSMRLHLISIHDQCITNVRSLTKEGHPLLRQATDAERVWALARRTGGKRYGKYR